jgi:hypothetical protein
MFKAALVLKSWKFWEEALRYAATFVLFSASTWLISQPMTMLGVEGWIILLTASIINWGPKFLAHRNVVFKPTRRTYKHQVFHFLVDFSGLAFFNAAQYILQTKFAWSMWYAYLMASVIGIVRFLFIRCIFKI